MEAPKQMDIDMGSESKLEAVFGPHDALLVKQTMRGCLQECLGCDAKSEYKVAPFSADQMDGYRVSDMAMSVPDVLYATEESSCCCRVCNPAGRNFQLQVSEGGGPGGQKVLYYDKPLSCPAFIVVQTENGGSMDCPCCCFLPNLTPMSPQGQALNSQSLYHCDAHCFVPKFTYHENGQQVYMVKPETCCGGCCVACDCCSGKGLVYIPFYFHDEKDEVIGGQYNDPNTPQIRKVWAGLVKECCSTADTFAVVFPQGSSAARKAGLLGLTFLIDFVYFEGHQSKNQT